VKKTVIIVFCILLATSILTGCANFEFGETDNFIVEAKESMELINDGAILVAVCEKEEYDTVHIDGAINIPMSSLVVNEPYKNMAPDKKQIKEVMSAAGVSENDTLLVYDNNSNMSAARVQWTLNLYDNFNVKVVSGGLEALKKAGMETTSEATVLDPAEYNTGDKQKKLVVSLSYVNLLIDKPEENVVIIDTRSAEEYRQGTIPGAKHIEYVWNNYANGEYKSVRDLQITYLEKGITSDMKIILFCKTSVRAAQTYAALKNAGYEDVRIYDAAWLEYESEMNPQSPVEEVPLVQDAS